jgi:hypothetical protein
MYVYFTSICSMDYLNRPHFIIWFEVEGSSCNPEFLKLGDMQKTFLCVPEHASVLPVFQRKQHYIIRGGHGAKQCLSPFSIFKYN